MAKIPLNIHLFLEEFDALEVLRGRWNPDIQPHIRRLEPREPLRFECWMLIQPPTRRRAAWADFVADCFDIDAAEVENQSAAAALILKVDGRLFAVSFGHGSGAFLREYLQPDFGLRFALNQIEEEEVQGLSSRTVEKNSLQRNHRITQPGALGRFGVDLNIEWIRQISGKRLNGERLTGGETAKLYWGGRLADLDALCREVLRESERVDYRQRFGEVDPRRPVPKGSPQHQALEVELARLVAEQSPDLALGYPEIPGPEVAGIRYTGGRMAEAYSELHIDTLYTFLRNHPNLDFRGAQVHEVDGGGGHLGSYPLHRCLIAQVLLNGQTFLLLEGTWFSVETDFIRRIDEQIAAMRDLTHILDLPTMGSAEKEGPYNARVATAKGWHCLDKRNVNYGNQKIEPCDLLLPSDRVPGLATDPPGPVLIAVKIGSGSDALSHLFAQGSNSARMLRDEPRFRTRVEGAYRAAFGADLDDRNALVVYAIATDKPGRLADSMFLFAKIHLAAHLSFFRVANIKVALCRIPKEVSLTVRAARVRRTQT